ncbi:MAG TPA: RNA-binding protein [Stellaceae bacterium]|nr:RNA-binding protein [Stellaceae bacterium]
MPPRPGSRATAGAARDRPEGGAEGGPERRCLASGAVRPKVELLRFVLAPDGRVVPDIAGKLPGRGLWLTARRDIVATAVTKRLFARAARQPVIVDEDLAERVEALLAERCRDQIGLARRAGQAVMGFAKVEATLAQGRAAVLLAAADGAADGRAKLRALAPTLPLIEQLSGRELGAAFGREHVVHAALAPGRIAQTLVADAARLAGFRGMSRIDERVVEA